MAFDPKHLSTHGVGHDGRLKIAQVPNHPFMDPRAVEHAQHVRGNAGNLARCGAAKHPSVSAVPPIHDHMFRVSNGEVLHGWVCDMGRGHALQSYPDADAASPLSKEPALSPKQTPVRPHPWMVSKTRPPVGDDEHFALGAAVLAQARKFGSR